MARIPLVAPEDLSPDLAEIYRTSPAGKLNIFRLHAHAPTVFPGYSAMAQAIFSKLDVPPLERELVVLVIAVLEDCEYEWAQHEQIALSMGIPQVQIDAVQASDASWTAQNPAQLQQDAARASDAARTAQYPA
jgi:AhpD family alkylhydroperoxidase